ncbi:MAG TPA: hypothetical protein PLD47_08650 [Aggregatilineales bacterium]|nr:hypothetical protein [Anaerolineales bacterium]HRE47781.1 hypothetical protein [Aggregatilineales bacterium]
MLFDPHPNADFEADFTGDIDTEAVTITPPSTFADLTLGQVVGRLFRQPLQTFDALRTTLAPLAEDRAIVLLGDERTLAPTLDFRQISHQVRAEVRRVAFPLILLALSVVGFFFSLSIVYKPGSPFPLESVPTEWQVRLGALGMLMFAMIALRTLRPAPLGRLAPPIPMRQRITTQEEFIYRYGIRAGVAGITLAFGYGAWTLTKDNALTTGGFICWVGVAFGALFVLYDRRQAPFISAGRWLRRRGEALRQPLMLRLSWHLAALVGIIALGIIFRFNALGQYPPDMTSDHVEKLLDALKIEQGLSPIFLPNNGGRESFQMYYLAALHRLTGIPYSFELLKIGTGLEGLLMILLAYGAARGVVGEMDKRLGEIVGLIMAAMVAMSYWHTMLSRLGLRIVLTTVAVTLLILFLSRAIRHNRRSAWLAAGGIIGIGMYWYQALRITPLLAVFALILAFLWRVRSWRVAREYTFNFACLVLVALALFIPSARYWNDYPEFFWMRTERSLLGDSMIQVKDEFGRITGYRQADLKDRLEAFAANFPEFADTFRRALLMYNVAGDRAWITGDPNMTPALDALTGTFFLFGFGVAVVFAVGRRDPVGIFLAGGVFIMLLPTALAIAFAREVPSATRASGSLPFVYMLAAWGMGVLLIAFADKWQRASAQRLIYGAAVVALLLSGVSNAHAYFQSAMPEYRLSTYPYRQAGLIVKNFVENFAPAGNAYMIGWDSWWDYRAVGIEAGMPEWVNGVLWDDFPARLFQKMAQNATSPYELDPQKPLMFLYHPQALRIGIALQTTFPGGSAVEVETFHKGRNFMVFTAPPPGCQWAAEQLGFAPRTCQNEN